MNTEELKAAFKSGVTVECGGIVYKCITAIIYRKAGNGFKIQAELQDRNTNSVSICNPDKITIAEGGFERVQ